MLSEIADAARASRIKPSHRLHLATYRHLPDPDNHGVSSAGLELNRAFVRTIYPTVAEAMQTGLYPFRSSA